MTGRDSANISRHALLLLSAVLLTACGGSGTVENPATANAEPQAASSSGGSGASPPAASSTTDNAELDTPNNDPTGTGSVTVSWTPPTENTDGSALTNLAGYRIYYGTNRASLSRSIQAGLGFTRYVVENLGSGTWYFAVRARNTAGAESALSNIASKTIS